MCLPIKENPLQQLRIGLIGALMVLQLFAVAVPLFNLAQNAQGLSFFFFIRQDVLVLAGLMVAILLAKPHPIPDARNSWLTALDRPFAIFAITLALIGICWAGHYLVFLGYDLSRDEQMANFDAYIFSHGRLFWPIPAEWRPYAQTLNQEFILPIGNHEAWVSAYLPINAAMRAVVGLIADPALTSPLLVGAGALALWRVAQHLWPDDRSARAVAMLLYVGSSQIILTGMTAYAMTGHLALNLIWLALFLHNRPVSHAAALGVGFLATGLHQPLFHPLFVLPFMWLLFREKRWRLMLFYGTGYGLICLFWLAWPVWISSHGIGAVAAAPGQGVGYTERLWKALKVVDISSLWLMTLNLFRFITWQHLLLLPLLAFGFRVAWKGEPTARALAAGLMLPVVAMLILLPYQGHGWGYRYVHGVIGNVCLLGAYGWRSLETEGHSMHRVLLWSSAISFLLLLPARAWMAQRMVTPYAEVSAVIDHSRADIAIVEDRNAPFAQDLVINEPDLSNKPIRILWKKIPNFNGYTLCSQRMLRIDKDKLAKIYNYFYDTVTASATDHQCDNN